MIVRIGSSGDELLATGPVARPGDQFVGLFEALTALRHLAQLFVNRLCIAGQVARRVAQLVFADGIADANEHTRFFNANGLQ